MDSQRNLENSDHQLGIKKPERKFRLDSATREAMPDNSYDACRHMLMLVLTGKISAQELDSSLPSHTTPTATCDRACPIADLVRNLVYAATLVQYARGEPTAIKPGTIHQIMPREPE